MASDMLGKQMLGDRRAARPASASHRAWYRTMMNYQ
jgi:hypothetical protein